MMDDDSGWQKTFPTPVGAIGSQMMGALMRHFKPASRNHASLDIPEFIRFESAAGPTDGALKKIKTVSTYIQNTDNLLCYFIPTIVDHSGRKYVESLDGDKGLLRQATQTRLRTSISSIVRFRPSVFPDGAGS